MENALFKDYQSNHISWDQKSFELENGLDINLKELTVNFLGVIMMLWDNVLILRRCVLKDLVAKCHVVCTSFQITQENICTYVYLHVCVHLLVCGRRKSTQKCKYNKILTTVKLGGGGIWVFIYYAFKNFCVFETFQKNKWKGKTLCSKPVSMAYCPLPDPKQTFLSSFLFHPLSSCSLYPNYSTSKNLTYGALGMC